MSSQSTHRSRADLLTPGPSDGLAASVLRARRDLINNATALADAVHVASDSVDALDADLLDAGTLHQLRSLGIALAAAADSALSTLGD